MQAVAEREVRVRLSPEPHDRWIVEHERIAVGGGDPAGDLGTGRYLEVAETDRQEGLMGDRRERGVEPERLLDNGRDLLRRGAQGGRELWVVGHHDEEAR